MPSLQGTHVSCLSLNLRRGGVASCSSLWWGRAAPRSYQGIFPQIISLYSPNPSYTLSGREEFLNPDQLSVSNLPLVLGPHWGGWCLLNDDISNLTTCHGVLLVGVFLLGGGNVADENVYDTNRTDDFL